MVAIGQRQQHDEEERLTPYDGVEWAGRSPEWPSKAEWEFKIVRAQWNAFRDPVVFDRLCEEERQVGWTLLEKLDDRRVRFKRPLALRELLTNQPLPFDPYRTVYRERFTWQHLPVAIAFLLAVILPAQVGYHVTAQTLARSHSPAPTQPAVPTALDASAPDPSTVPAAPAPTQAP
jgi:hypothetical protein